MIDRAVHSDVNFPISPDGCLTGGGRTDGPSGFTGPSGRARLCGWRGAGAQWPVHGGGELPHASSTCT